MKSISIGHIREIQLLILVTIFFFGVTGITFARGYGSGDGEGQNHNDYVPIAEARFFAVYDVNRDGFLVSEEVAAMGMPDSFFIKTDSNKNGKLSRDEFAKMWANSPE
jgi:hypothetical protein